MRCPVPVVLAIVGGLLLSGCGGGGGSGSKSRPPWLVLTSPTGVQSSEVIIDYVANDLSRTPLDIDVRYSTDGGSTFSPASDAGPAWGSDGTTAVSSSPPPGTPHRFVWDSMMDLPGAILPDVRVRMTPTGKKSGISETTAPFSLNNNRIPLVVVQTPSGAVSGDVTIGYILIDMDSDLIDIAAEYSLNGGLSYNAATQGVGGDPTTALSSSAAGVPHTFVWASASDVSLCTTVRFRVVPTDPHTTGPAGETNDFAIATNGRPSAITQTPASPATADITIDYTLADPESDPVNVVAFYSLNGGASYNLATQGAGGSGTTGLATSPGGIAYTFVWDSMADTGLSRSDTARFRIFPADTCGAGIPGDTPGDFTVDNGDRPLAVIQTPTSPASGDITVNYDLLDPDSDPLDLIVEYSTDAGVTFQAATEGAGSQGTTAMTSSPTGVAHIYVWESSTDVGANLRPFTRLKISPSDGLGPGQPGETADFVLDNTVAASRIYTLDIPVDPAGPDTISGYDIGGGGALTAMAGSPWATGGSGRQMSSGSDLVVSPNGRFLFASHSESLDISVYELDPSGVPVPVPGSPFPSSSSTYLTTLGVHQSGDFLYASLGNNDQVDGFSIDPVTGALTLLPGFPYTAGSSSRDMVVHPKGDFLYTGHMFGADEGVRVHAINPVTGAVSYSSWLDLSSWAGRPGGDMAIDPQGLRLFCGSLDAGIFVADIDAVTGALTLVPSAPLSTGFIGSLCTTNRGDYVYLHLSFNVELHGYKVQSDGSLTAVPGSPYTNTGGTSLYMSVDGPDTFLFVSSRSNNDIRIYEIQADGSLIEQPSSPFANPNPAGVPGPLLPYP